MILFVALNTLFLGQNFPTSVPHSSSSLASKCAGILFNSLHPWSPGECTTTLERDPFLQQDVRPRVTMSQWFLHHTGCSNSARGPRCLALLSIKMEHAEMRSGTDKMGQRSGESSGKENRRGAERREKGERMSVCERDFLQHLHSSQNAL